jgi:hypothetical protein
MASVEAVAAGLFCAEKPFLAPPLGPARAHGIAGASVAEKISNWC